MRQIWMITGGAILIFSLMVGGFALNQANQEEIELSSRLQSRTQLLADSLAESIGPSYRANATTTLASIVNRFVSDERLVGLAVFDNAANAIALSEGIPEKTVERTAIETVMDSNEPDGVFVRIGGENLYAYTIPLTADGRVIGALTVVQNASYIDEGVRQVWLNNAMRLLLQIVIFALTVFLFLRFVILGPISKLTRSIQSLRAGEEPEGSVESEGFWQPLSSEISKMTHSLKQARSAASEEARLRLEKLDTPWTAERLREFMKAYLKDRPLFVVSNREPYEHQRTKNGIICKVPAGGLITALEPVMAACGGMWLAHGSGSADKETADAHGKINVPPEEPKYTLKRIWLTEEEVQGYYTGFSNESLWPLCIMAHTRPLFRKEDWNEYWDVNELFAKQLLAEVKQVKEPLILIQDYHFALLPALIRKSRPDARIAIFWHIPWPSAETFSICPWRKEILEGMLGADIVGFHTQQFCNNFIDTVGSEIESRIDFDRFSITRAGRTSHVKPFPISIAFTDPASKTKAPSRDLLDRYDISSRCLGVGVDRLDYAKGILERFKGIEFFLDEHPEYRGQFTFLQIAAPSRESVEKYREYAQAVAKEAERINERFSTKNWRPIVFEKKHHSHAELRDIYRLADFCLITSVHDGMNLVAKEFAAARDDEQGVLILSQFTGAARELKGPILINPYSAEETSEAIHQALTMPHDEQRGRMSAMRTLVSDFNVYRWAAELVKAMVSV